LRPLGVLATQDAVIDGPTIWLPFDVQSRLLVKHGLQNAGQSYTPVTGIQESTRRKAR
jgi:hypothetical protein